MRVLVVGAGAREHALCRALAHNAAVDRIYAAPGNAGMREFATVERPECCGVFVAGTAAWLRGQDGSARKLGDAVYVVDLWWSRDGTRLFAEGGGDDSVGGISDLLSGKGVMQFCKRGGGPPPTPCT